MLDFLTDGVATIQVQFDRPGKRYYAGETIHATVQIKCVQDLQIHQAKITLLSRETYEYGYWGPRRRGGRKDTQTRTDELKIWEKQFLDETGMNAGSTRTFKFDIPLPPKALPTIVGGAILNHEWVVKTIIDRPFATDVENIQRVFVATGASGKMPGAGVYGSSNEPRYAELALGLDNTEFQVGEIITGELFIRPQKELKAKEIRVELQQREYVPLYDGNEAKIPQTLILAERINLAPGSELVYPFQLRISNTSAITCRTPNGSIDWFMRGVLYWGYYEETVVEQEVVVYSASWGLGTRRNTEQYNRDSHSFTPNV
jgi:hypothetical protein